MHDTTRLNIYWPQIASYVCGTAKHFHFCPSQCQTNNWQEKLRLLYPAEALEFVLINIVGTLPNIKRGDQYIIEIKDW